jgi:integrase
MPARHRRLTKEKGQLGRAADLRGAAKSAKRDLVWASVRPSSAAQYDSRLNVVAAWHREQGLETLTPETFTLFLQQCMREGKAAVEGYRAALAKVQLAEGLECWADGEEYRAMAKAVAKAASDRKVDKGSFTEPMIVEIIGSAQKTLRKRCSWQNASSTQGKVVGALCGIGFLSQLRISQLMRMRVGDAGDDESGGTLVVRGDKRQGRTQVHVKPIDAACLEAIRAWEDNIKGKTVYLFPQEAEKWLRALLRKREDEGLFPEGLDWSGIHTLRHGGVRRIREKAEELLTGMYSEQTPSTAKFYARPISTRKKRRHEEKDHCGEI